MPPSVAAFTDTYLPTVNGVTYTVRTWRDRWRRRGGRMDVVYPASSHDPDDGEYPVRSLPFPFYDGFRVGAPTVPDAVCDVDLVHAHTGFSLGVGALRLARDRDLPLVASYHTPSGEYTSYVTDRDRVESGLERVTQAYERWYFDRADVVIAPTEATRDHLIHEVGVTTPIYVLSNGVDTDRFRPVETAEFRDRYDLAGPLVGYTGRHGYEKRLGDLIEAAPGIDGTVVLGGEGPATDDLRDRAADLDADVRFLGFLDREELPAFYSALDVFAFPSPVETEGLVALEAIACGTPVVGADDGALATTIDDGATGYHFPTGDVDALVERVERALSERERLSERCLDRRDEIGVDDAVDRLATIYDRVTGPSQSSSQSTSPSR